jgi:hypothetical protein
MKDFHPHLFLYLDESHFESSMQGRNFDYSQKGEKAQSFNNKPKTKRYSLICVMSAYEVVLYTIIDTTKSGVNENIFIKFLEDLTLLMPNNSILIIHNTKIHHKYYGFRILLFATL